VHRRRKIWYAKRGSESYIISIALKPPQAVEYIIWAGSLTLSHALGLMWYIDLHKTIWAFRMWLIKILRPHNKQLGFK
jgi:hypothetical protein